MTEPSYPSWEALRPFEGDIAPDAQVLIIAGQGGAKSTLTASLLLDAPSLVAIDSKGRLTLPRSRLVELPQLPDKPSAEALATYDAAIAAGIRYQDAGHGRRLRLRPVEPPSNRVILRVHALDVDDPLAHDRIFRAIYLYRYDTITWIDEITGTGVSARQLPRWLRAISARGRTRGQGLWTMTQAAFGLVPPLLRRNADLIIIGSLDREDARELPFDGAELAATIPRKTGRFIVWVSGEREPYRLYVPIPRQLAHWTAPGSASRRRASVGLSWARWPRSV